MNADLDRPLEDAEYEELGAILQARAEQGEGPQLDTVHGLLTAVAIGPEAPAPDAWMPLILREGEPFATMVEAERAVTLILRLYNTIAAELENLRWEPVLGQTETESGEPVLSARGWCEGFAQGVDLRGETWERRMAEDPALLDLLTPVLHLAGDAGVFESEAGEELPPLSEAEYEDALDRLPNAVHEVCQYWREHPPELPFAPRGADPEPRPVPRRRAGRSVH